MRRFHIVNVTPGSAVEMGRQHGFQAVEKVNNSLADYRSLFAPTSTMSRQETCESVLMSFTPIVRGLYFEPVGEVGGITVAGIIYNLTEGLPPICTSPSCEGEFVAVPL